MTEQELNEDIKSKAVQLDIAEQPVSQELKDLLTAMLTKNPAERPTITKCREYAWLKGLDGLVCNTDPNPEPQ